MSSSRTCPDGVGCSEALLEVADTLVKRLKRLRFSEPVAYVYNPLDYARASHARYIELYGRQPREVILLGMNPGPWGMVQTGVPFGEVQMARDWLGIDEEVKQPARQHPKRAVEGFACTRSEVSGARLWGWAKERFITPDAFFERFYVANYCPLAFLEEGGKNRTPDKLPVAERDALHAICDDALRRTVEILSPAHVIGIGAFAARRAEAALTGASVRFGQILHPSPASPAANRGWAPQAERQLRQMGIDLPES